MGPEILAHSSWGGIVTRLIDHPVTLAIRGEVYAKDDSGMVLLIGDELWPMVWSKTLPQEPPQLGQWVRCLVIPHGGRSPVYTFDHPPELVVWTPARIPAGHKALGGAKE